LETIMTTSSDTTPVVAVAPLKNRRARRDRVLRGSARVRPAGHFTPAATSQDEGLDFPKPAMPELPQLKQLESTAAQAREQLVLKQLLAVPPAPAPAFERPNDPVHVHAVLLDWLGQQPVAFSRVFVDITGSVLSALWLSHVLNLVQFQAGQLDSASGEFIFELTAQACHEATGLTEREQTRSRTSLMELGLLGRPKAQPGGPAKARRKAGQADTGPRWSARAWSLNLGRLAELLLEHSRPLAQTLVHERTLAEQLLADKLQSRSEQRRKRITGGKAA
jgi:hypothetical protein